MKFTRLLKNIYAVLLFAAVSSCTNKFEVDSPERVEEGLPASVRFGFGVKENVIITRKEQGELFENRVDNVYIIIFKEDGSVHERKFCTEGSGLTYTDGNPGKNTGQLYIETKSINNARIVGIANLTTETTSTAYSISPADLDAVTSFEQMKNLCMKMRNESIERGALFMMTGFAKDRNDPDNELVTIPGGEGSVQTLDAVLKLERTDAKVKFVVKANPNPPAGVTWSDFSFMPKEWVVKRVPKQSYVMESSDGDYSGSDAEYFNSNKVVFEDITRDENNSNLYTGGSFVFYMPENRKKPKKEITVVEGERELYAQRESWSTELNGDKVFENANDNSTYVEMTGTLSYVDGIGHQVSADVRFTVHLGFESGSANDYDTYRNGYYTYNVSVRGIDDIIYEVTNQDDRRPGYEGDVVYSSESIFEFDSHYDRRLITLNRKDIADGMKWSVNTPFSRGIHELGQPIEESMRDYRWIKFAINYDYNVSADQYVKYPGDQNYDDPFPMDESQNDQSSPYYSQGGAGYNAERNTDKARLLDIDQLLLRLRDEPSDSPIFDAAGNVAITVFVDENLYFNHPITNQPGEDNRSLWKLTSDKEDRQLHIIAGGSQSSADGNSSIVNSKYSFKQRSIRTIFNVDNPDLKTAWGLESVMETGRMKAGTVSTSGNTSNGRLNTLLGILGTNYMNNKNVSWTSIVGTDDFYSLQGEQTALRACLLRNRDLNGDNIVDASEIRWYLASIDQLTDIFLGEYALDEKSRLYPANAADRENKVRWHYTSSSNNNGGVPWVLWAEEGASRGGASGSTDDNGATNNLFSYRCARNLGLSLSDPDEVPEDLVMVTKEPDGNYLIDLSRMNPKSLRSNFETSQLPPHDERDPNNRPYVKFRVHKDVSPKPEYIRGLTWAWNTQSWKYYQTWIGYPAGFRIPNQRELLIMATRMPNNAWETFHDLLKSITPDYVCQTAFSLNGKWPYSSSRDGFMWHSSNRDFFLQNDSNNGGPEKGYVRPVQDVQ